MYSLGLIDKEEVYYRILDRMEFVKEQVEDPKLIKELELLTSLIGCTVLDTEPIVGWKKSTITAF